MKSLLVSVFWPAWEWIQHPEHRWLYSSYASWAQVKGPNLATATNYISQLGFCGARE
jgi:hypothetical protein